MVEGTFQCHSTHIRRRLLRGGRIPRAGGVPTLSGKAAALMHSLACNHALVDGNKRLVLLATVVFLRVNGHRLDLTDDEAFDLTMSVAAGQLDADGIEKRLRLALA
jgi:death-on-curing family protein